ncbi:MAG: ATP-dependent helicase [Actinobacteria bacterium]|nr:ATP-dependent helicase [Actinomycetota bacterium]
MLERMFDTDQASYLAALNEPQRAAVTHGDGPLLVIAGAGTGKTKTLACRVAHLIATGVAPERILLLTFTRRAAGEMLGRVGRHTSPEAAARVWGGTFHSVAHRLLRIYGAAAGLDAGFTVMDVSDASDLMSLVRNELRVDTSARRLAKPETLVAIYSRTVNSRTRLADVLAANFPWCAADAEPIKTAFEAYTQRKRGQNVLDFDDLLLFWKAILGAPRISAVLRDLFDHILVDEYQDTNAIQGDILRSMRSDPANITVVGDDAQAIYSFRAATVRNIVEFPESYPGTRRVMLEQNYRSLNPILEASNAVMAGSRTGYAKMLWTERSGGTRPLLLTCTDEAAQSDAVCAHVLEQRERGIELKQQAVLFRAAQHSAHLEIELSRRNIPFVKYGGLRFIEAAHIKDIIALLRVLENPWDELAWWRTLQLLDGIGPSTSSKIMAELGVRPRSQRSPLSAILETPPKAPAPAAPHLEELRTALGDCTAKTGQPAVEIERLTLWCTPSWQRQYDNAAARVADAERLAQIASGYSSRSRLIADLCLDPPQSTGELAGAPMLDEDYLNLSTIHSAKGCEWEAVHVIHAADGMIPSDMATKDADEIEEERRLFYVALTRAKQSLFVHFPLRYYHRRMGLDDAHGYAQLTRFLPAQVRGLFEQRAWGAPEEDDARNGPSLGGAERVDRWLSDLWG